MSATVLSLFNSRLSSPDSQVRISAAQALSSELAGASSSSENINYALRRLVRGLASPKETSRLGFATAIVEVLSSVESIQLGDLITLVLSITQPSSSATNSEEKDLLIARLLGLSAIWQSITFRSTSMTPQQIVILTVESIKLAQQKNWLVRPSYQAILTGINSLKSLSKDDNVNGNVNEFAQKALQEIADNALSSNPDISTWSPEQLGVAIALQNNGPASISWDRLNIKKQSSKILSQANLSTIAQILKNADANSNLNIQKLSNSESLVHFAWYEIVKSLAQDEYAKSLCSFSEIFKTVVEGTLFSPSSSQKQKQTGLLIFELCFNSASDQEKVLLFTPNFVRTWTTHLSGKDKHLNQTAKKVADSISDSVTKESSTTSKLALLILQKFTSSKSIDVPPIRKIVENIIKSLDTHAESEWTKQCINRLLNDKPDSSDDEDKPFERFERNRMWHLDQLVSLVRKQNSISKPHVDQVLHFLCLHGYFEVVKSSSSSKNHAPVTPFSDSIKNHIRIKLFTLLSFFATTSHSEKIHTVNQKIENLLADKNLTPIFGQDQSTKDNQTALRNSIKTCAKSKDAKFDSLATIGETILLQVYSDQDSADLAESFVDTVEALTTPSSKSASPEKKSSSSSSKHMEVDGEQDGEPAQPTTLLLNLLIELLQHPLSLFKVLAHRVLESFAQDISDQALQLLLDQITPNYDDEENDDEDGSEESDDEEEDDEAEEEEEDADDEEGSDNDDDEKFRNQIAQAILESGLAPEEDEDEEDSSEKSEKSSSESDQEEQDDDKEILLNDEQMFHLDDKLAAIFRERKAAKANEKSAQIQAVHAQHKILDLVEILSKTKQPFHRSFQLIQSLFTVATAPGNTKQEIGKKSIRILQSLVSKDPTPLDKKSQDLQPALEFFNHVHLIARDAPDAQVSNVCEITSLYFVKALSPASSKSILETYIETIQDLLSRHSSKVSTSLITSFIKRNPSLASPLAEPLLESLDSTSTTVKPFKRLQSIQLIYTLLNSLSNYAKKSGENQDQVNKISILIGNRFTEYINSPDPSKLLSTQGYKEFFKLALQVARTISPDSVNTSLNLTSLKQGLESLSTNNPLKNVGSIHSLGRQLVAIVEKRAQEPLKATTKNTPTKKPNGSSSTPTSDSKSKKKKHSNDASSESQPKKKKRKD